MGETRAFSIKSVQNSESVGSGQVWVTMKALGGVGKILINPLAEREFKLKWEQAQEKIRRRESLRRGVELPLTLLEESFARGYFGTYVHGWDCFDDANGNPFVFNEENVAGVFVCGIPGVISGKIPGLWEEVSGFVNSRQDEHKERIESNLGNS